MRKILTPENFGRETADAVVNASGPFAVTLGRWVWLDLPIYQMRGRH